MSEHLISAKDMARFVTSGYLKYENMVPKELCEECRKEIKETYFYERIYEIAVNSIENGIFATSFLQHIEEGQEQDISHFVGEFWAFIVEGYIMNRPGFKDSHNTREWIAEHDPDLFELITRYFPTTPWEFCKGIDAFYLDDGKYDF